METPLPQGPRLWLLRLAALTLVPAVFFLAVEGALRLGGFGHPTKFFIAAPTKGEVMTNQKFGWRFFPSHLARAPVPAIVEVRPPAGVFRIMVLGGSAARGTPEPAFSFGRALEALLEGVYPEARFEVLNGAMTAINSHVVLPIARDVGRLAPDLVIVYMGNNEVVGPYGAATIFSPYSPQLGLIRAGLAAKTWRLGQLVNRGVNRRGGEGETWRGMEMFLEQRIAASSPGLEGVYGHLRVNLTDLVTASREAGAQVLLSTVAVNLRDQPPFASLHRPDLKESERQRFEEWLAVARQDLDGGDPARALERLAAAEEIDDTYAESHFHRGHALLALGRVAEARESLMRARDLDALRFRADGRINQVIAEVAEVEGVPLVDAATLFLEGAGLGSPLPGRRLFYEHVHLNFVGNYALARVVLTEVEKLLPAEVRGGRRGGEPPALSAVAARLAFTPYDAEAMEREILGIVSRPPFVGQWGHRQDLIVRRSQLRHMRRGFGEALWLRSAAQYEARLAEYPDDLLARRRFAELLVRHGEEARAVEHWRKLLHAVPDILSWYDAYALALAGAGRGAEAVQVLEEALARFSEDEGKILVNQGSALERMGEPKRAAAAYRRAWKVDPSEPVALYNLATLEARGGDLKGAIELYRELVARHPHFAGGHHNLGVALERAGDLEGAAASYRREIAAQPEHPKGYSSLGLVLAARGDVEGATVEYLRALERDPEHASTLFHLADLLLTQGRAAEAAAYYERGLAVEPGNARARANFSVAVEATFSSTD